MQQIEYHYEERKISVRELPTKRRNGKQYTQDDANIDIEAAEKAWPNFKTFFHWFKDHTALGPGAVEELGVVPGISVVLVLVARQGLNRRRIWPHLKALDPLAGMQWRVLVTVRRRRKKRGCCIASQQGIEEN